MPTPAAYYSVCEQLKNTQEFLLGAEEALRDISMLIDPENDPSESEDVEYELVTNAVKEVLSHRDELLDACKLALRDFDAGGKYCLSFEAAGALRASIARKVRGE